MFSSPFMRVIALLAILVFAVPFSTTAGMSDFSNLTLVHGHFEEEGFGAPSLVLLPALVAPSWHAIGMDAPDTSVTPFVGSSAPGQISTIGEDLYDQVADEPGGVVDVIWKWSSMIVLLGHGCISECFSWFLAMIRGGILLITRELLFDCLLGLAGIITTLLTLVMTGWYYSKLFLTAHSLQRHWLPDATAPPQESNSLRLLNSSANRIFCRRAAQVYFDRRGCRRRESIISLTKAKIVKPRLRLRHPRLNLPYTSYLCKLARDHRRIDVCAAHYDKFKLQTKTLSTAKETAAYVKCFSTLGGWLLFTLFGFVLGILIRLVEDKVVGLCGKMILCFSIVLMFLLA